MGKLLLRNFIQENLNSSYEQLQVLPAPCPRLAMLRISDNDFGCRWILTPFPSQLFCQSHSSSGKSTVNVSNYRSLCTEIFKTLNDINPSFRKDIFELRMTNYPTREKYKLNLEMPKSIQVRFGTKTLRYLGPRVWNSLPYHIKSSKNLTIFKTKIKNRNGTVCSCKIFKMWNYILFASFLPLYELIISFIIVSDSAY